MSGKHMAVGGLIVVLLAAVALLCGCGPAGDKARADDRELRFDMKDNGSRIEVEAGAILTISLEANLTTGFTWEAVGDHEPVLAQLGEPEYTEDPQDPQLLGAGGVQTWRFQAAKAGETKLELVYHRPWEKDEPPLESFVLTVAVR